MHLKWIGCLAAVASIFTCRCDDEYSYDEVASYENRSENYDSVESSLFAQCTINGKCPKEMVEILRKERAEQRAAEAKAKAVEVNSQISDMGIDLNNSDDWDDEEEDYGDENIDEPNGYLFI